jgi:hypothetical protein
MAYNNYFPNGYGQQYFPQFQSMVGAQMPSPNQPQSPVQNTNIIWVSGEAGAKSYLVAPNTTVQLWDSEAQVIYLKSADASGMPSMKIIDYTIRNAAPTTQQQMPQGQQVLYVTKNEFDAFKQEVQKMIGGKVNESTVSTNESAE